MVFVMKPCNVVKLLQSDNSRLFKEQAVLETWNNQVTDFFIGAKLCYDGMTTFGVKQVPIKDSNTGNETFTFPDFIELANNLSSRTITGHAARDLIIASMQSCDKDDWNSFYRLILLKDLKAGLSESTINKVLKKIGKETELYLIAEFPYQRCSLPKDAKLDLFSWKDGVYSQTKSDGLFLNGNVYADGSVDLLTRSGKLFPIDHFINLIADISKTFTKDTQLHGELLVFRNNKELPREIGNGILNKIAQGGQFDSGDTPVYVVWDQIPLSSVVAKGVYNVPYKTRIENITAQIKNSTVNSVQLVETRIVHSMQEAKQHYTDLVTLGYEGTIIKEPTASWKDGTSKFQVKLKVDFTVDLTIIGFRPGNGKNEALFGSIVCQTSDGLLEVGVSGFKDDERIDIWNRKEELIGTIMAVTANGIMKPTSNNALYSLFLPRKTEFRLDKHEADTLQRVIDQFEQSIKA